MSVTFPSLKIIRDVKADTLDTSSADNIPVYSALPTNVQVAGSIIYNSADATLRVSNGASWVAAGAGVATPNGIAVQGNTTQTATASGTNSIAVGNRSTASGTTSIAIGSNNSPQVTTATATSAIAIGFSTAAQGTGDVVLGESASTGVTGTQKIAIGSTAQANGAGAIAIGAAAQATAANSMTLGSGLLTNNIPGATIIQSNAVEQFRLNPTATGGFIVRDVAASVTGASVTPTAAQMLGGALACTTAGNTAVTLPTAAALDTAVQGTGATLMYTGMSFQCFVYPTTANQVSFVTNTGLTLVGVIAPAVASKAFSLMFLRTGAAAWTVVIV